MGIEGLCIPWLSPYLGLNWSWGYKHSIITGKMYGFILKYVWVTVRASHVHTYIHIHIFRTENKNNWIFIILKTKKKIISIIKWVFWRQSNIILFHIINFSCSGSMHFKTYVLLEVSTSLRPGIMERWTYDTQELYRKKVEGYLKSEHILIMSFVRQTWITKKLPHASSRTQLFLLKSR